ncbi:MAG: ATP-dependent DNA ligase [Promethearchaeota archaeon]
MQLESIQIEKQVGNYILGSIGSMPKPVVVEKVDDYKKHVSQGLIPIYPDKINEMRTGTEISVSIKYDGWFAGFYYNAREENYKSAFFSSHHRTLMGLMINDEIERILISHNVESIILVGELLGSAHDPPDFDQKCRVSDINHYVRMSDPNYVHRIGFRVFDIIEINGQSVSQEYFEQRYQRITNLFNTGGMVGRALYQTINRSELAEFYRAQVETQHHEGLVVRTGGIGYKIKPVHTLDVAIIGALNGRYGSEIGQDQLARALMALRYPNGDYQLLGSVGGGLTEEQRTLLWSRMNFVNDPPFIIPSRDGRTFRMVKPELVAEILYMDIIADRRGEPIKQLSIKYSEHSQEWSMVRPLPFVRLLSPRFSNQMLREDKTTAVNDVRVAQLLDLVELPGEVIQEPIEYPESTILRRRVYQKVMKEKAMIRKFILWKTNKNPEEYPSYVVYYLDFSPNRKGPIKRDVKFTNSEAQAFELFDDLMSSQVKKGWELKSDVIKIKKT